jgi:hypothetical protein
MKYMVAVFYCLPDKECISDVTRNHIETFLGFDRQIREHAPIAATVIFDKSANASPFFQQGFNKMGADKASGSCD